MKKLNLLSVIVLVFLAHSCNTGDIGQKPNILFIIADDQCYQTVHAMGGEEVRVQLLPMPTIWADGMAQSAWQAGPC